MADIATAVVSGSAGLVGALIGAFSAQMAARKARDSDRRKRCVDRILAALNQLDKAYADYVMAAAARPDDPHVVLPLQGALRAYNQAAGTLNIESLRNAAVCYREQLTEFYLMFGQPRDPLDIDRPVLTLQQLNDQHSYLFDKLRRYEKT
ncbi:hypothetical protein [Mycobacteroides abscessus]|uniref:hypothetical protein n=1 Tax=Mycobacteroides abscessus TaxID=36809 RepID=UPI00266EBF28|nr:hypothetical protein [Mycobacteroides abscessus]MDO3110297.1 hypothetical protein [Mycobacteroides abscessus subsp. abscessus]